MPSQHKVTPIGVRLPEAERQAVKAAAQREGVAVNEWLKRAIRERLAMPQLGDPVPGAGCTQGHVQD